MHRNLLFFEIPLQAQGAAGGIIQVEHDAFIEKFFEIRLVTSVLY